MSAARELAIIHSPPGTAQSLPPGCATRRGCESRDSPTPRHRFTLDGSLSGSSPSLPDVHAHLFTFFSEYTRMSVCLYVCVRACAGGCFTCNSTCLPETLPSSGVIEQIIGYSLSLFATSILATKQFSNLLVWQ